MTTTPHLVLPMLAAGQAQKHVTHNEALFALDALLHCAVKDKDLATPPGSPADGDRYIVAVSPTGAWTGKAGQIAAWQDGLWRFHAPKAGWIAFVIDELQLYHHNGTAWAPGVLAITNLQNLSLLGIGIAADAANPFSAKLNNVLHTARTVAEGGSGHIQVKLSKEAAAKTASLLFQTNFSGRAEIGLTGDDNLYLKVSPDGAAWTEAIVVDRTTGAVAVTTGSTGATPAAGANDAQLATTAFVEAAAIRQAAQCRLTKSGANLLLSPHNGGRIVIDGVARTIPVAGVSLAPAGLTAGTTYFIFAFMNAGAVALEASATAHATHTNGVEVKSGDASRTLVGMARPIAGPSFADTAAQRLVLSWFNRVNKSLAGSNTNGTTTSSTSFVELAVNSRIEFLAWPDEALTLSGNGSISNDTASTYVRTQLGVDSAAPQLAGDVLAVNAVAGGLNNAAFIGFFNLAEGYHYATPLGKVAAGTGQYYLALNGVVRG